VLRADLEVSDSDESINALTGELRSSWQRFLDEVEPLRPELYRYCRHLTRTPWDAEDLVQDAMARAFVTLATVFTGVPNQKAWLFRVASNLWIDRVRRARLEARVEPELGASVADPQAAREAAGTLLALLSPQERAAVVLKDVLDFSLEEIADALSTSVGAIKAALHRGRGRLAGKAATDVAPERAPAPAVLDACCAAFNARDIDRLAALLLDTAVIEIVGVVTEYGPEAAKHPRTGSLHGMNDPITLDDRGGVPNELLEGYLGGLARCEARVYRGQHILLFWYDHVEGPRVRCVMTLATESDRIVHARNYFFTPDIIEEICSELGVPFSTNGYRYWPKSR
jgi:RNA polymerase sigma-70 factor (ECF subfamily)